MAQSGYTPLISYYSSSPGVAPSAGNLNPGELAINIYDGILYYKNASGLVKSIGITGGSANQFIYIDGTGNIAFAPAPTAANTYLQWTGSAFTWATAGGGGGGTGWYTLQYNPSSGPSYTLAQPTDFTSYSSNTANPTCVTVCRDTSNPGGATPITGGLTTGPLISGVQYWIPSFMTNPTFPINYSANAAGFAFVLAPKAVMPTMLWGGVGSTTSGFGTSINPPGQGSMSGTGGQKGYGVLMFPAYGAVATAANCTITDQVHDVGTNMTLVFFTMSTADMTAAQLGFGNIMTVSGAPSTWEMFYWYTST